MKVFFTTSQRGKKYFLENYQKIFNLLKENSYQHLDDMIMNVNSKDFYNDLENKGYKQYQQLYENATTQIKNADIVVIECSLPSLSLGFMIEKALEYNKPVIVLYVKDNIPYFLAGSNDEKLILVEYDLGNVSEKIKEALKKAKNLTDTRFNFFISPKLLSYLRFTSNKQGITKSTFIRNLLNEHMKNNQ